jgi:hypothetical protein
VGAARAPRVGRRTRIAFAEARTPYFPARIVIARERAVTLYGTDRRTGRLEISRGNE